MKKLIAKIVIILMITLVPRTGYGMNAKINELFTLINKNKISELASKLKSDPSFKDILNFKQIIIPGSIKNGTLLHVAAYKENLAAAQLLVAYGADANIKDANEKKPRQVIPAATLIKEQKHPSSTRRISYLLEAAEVKRYAKISIEQYEKMVGFMNQTKGKGQETGGNVYGKWENELPVIEFVMGTGPLMKATSVSFYDDAAYLIYSGTLFMVSGYEHLGGWHSHHTLETFPQPSGGDASTAVGAMNTYNRDHFLICISRFEGEEKETIFRPYIFEKNNSSPSEACWQFDTELSKESNKLEAKFEEQLKLPSLGYIAYVIAEDKIEELLQKKPEYKDFIKKNINLTFDYKTHKQVTLLHVTVIENSLQVAQLLVNLGANVNAQNGDGQTPLFLAIQKVSIPVVEYLLSLDSITPSLTLESGGRTPLEFVNYALSFEQMQNPATPILQQKKVNYEKIKDLLEKKAGKKT